MSFPGTGEMILIFLAILLLFGAKRIPEIAQGLGKGIREFKDATQDIKKEMTTPAPPPAPYQIPPPAATPQVFSAPAGTAEPVPVTPSPTAAPSQPMADARSDDPAPRP